MTTYTAEPDPEFPGQQALVVRVCADPDENGTVVGWCTGPQAMANAIAAAQVISFKKGQPNTETADRLGYTPKDGVTW